MDWKMPDMKFEPHRIVWSMYSPSRSFMLRFSKFIVGWDKCLDETDLLIFVNSDLIDPAGDYVVFGTAVLDDVAFCNRQSKLVVTRCEIAGVAYETITGWAFLKNYTSEWSMAQFGALMPEKWYALRRLK